MLFFYIYLIKLLFMFKVSKYLVDFFSSLSLALLFLLGGLGPLLLLRSSLSLLLLSILLLLGARSLLTG